MKNRGILILAVILSTCVFIDGFAVERPSSGDIFVWSNARKLWEDYLNYPTIENCKKFYNFVCKVPVNKQNEDFTWLVKNYRFELDIRCGNIYVVLAALRISLVAEEKQATQIYRKVAELCRISPGRFLDALAESADLLGDRIKNIIIALPRAYEYLSKATTIDESYDGFLSYFICREYIKRYMAIKEVKKKKYKEVQKTCLSELSRQIEQMNKCQDGEVDDDVFVKKFNSLWNLPINDKLEIFSTPLDRDYDRINSCDGCQIIAVLASDNDPDFNLFDMLDYEIQSGNYNALEYMTLSFSVSIRFAKEHTIWDLIRIRPELFLRYVKNFGENPEFINPFNSYDYIRNNRPVVNMQELNQRIKTLSKVNNKQYEALLEKYTEIMRNLISKEARMLVNEKKS